MKEERFLTIRWGSSATKKESSMILKLGSALELRGNFARRKLPHNLVGFQLQKTNHGQFLELEVRLREAPKRELRKMDASSQLSGKRGITINF